MKLEKRGAAAKETAPEGTAPEKTTPEETAAGTAEVQHNTQKPVLVYIVILFVAAALLIVVSLLMHQRSNEEVLGELQSSVNVLETLQKSQERNMELYTQTQEQQRQIQDLTDQLANAEAQLASTQASAETAAGTVEALQWLLIIEQQYAADELDTCRESITRFRESGTVDYLPTENTLTETALAPSERFAAIESEVAIYETE